MNVLLEKSLINCHCYGLDSLVLKDAPRMVRIFVARPGHLLYRNAPKHDEPLSIAIHPHHCDITMIPIVGPIFNVSVGDDPSGANRYLWPFKYKSPISGDEGSFALDTETRPGVAPLCMDRVSAPLFLPATRPHTVYVPKNSTAAWMIWEVAENPEHDPLTWSDDRLELFDFSAHDLPMTPERLAEDLAILNVKSGEGWL
jgi:hypothetical protein